MLQSALSLFKLPLQFDCVYQAEQILSFSRFLTHSLLFHSHSLQSIYPTLLFARSLQLPLTLLSHRHAKKVKLSEAQL